MDKIDKLKKLSRSVNAAETALHRVSWKEIKIEDKADPTSMGAYGGSRVIVLTDSGSRSNLTLGLKHLTEALKQVQELLAEEL